MAAASQSYQVQAADGLAEKSGHKEKLWLFEPIDLAICSQESSVVLNSFGLCV